MKFNFRKKKIIILKNARIFIGLKVVINRYEYLKNRREVYRIYRLENMLFTWLNQATYNEIEREKLKFGIQMIISESSKTLIIYLTAFFLDCVIPTLITHLTFFFLRQVCFGYHFRNLYVCIGWSLISFPLVTRYLANLDLDFSTAVHFFILGIFLVSIYILAPQGTENQPIISQQHRRYLRKKITVRLCLLVVIFFITPSAIKIFITYGLFLETLMLLLQLLKERFR
ncbi:accessory gene regulator ArgB-like protein [Lysinibacillus sp. SGAir0095]|uniref:accessory gene regulator ArgB-like protein n=1 Tax=Lysinibacillus sp. SGAir0095 TaxID=2070463 RepID=UPI0010CD449E|nr:hypothetical protein C1N55_15410 [Lysinibacillus sp. SGAir0095]